jgi:hypothetical protein
MTEIDTEQGLQTHVNTTMKKIYTHRQMARRMSFIHLVELPRTQLETTGNNGYEISLSLPCHGNNEISWQNDSPRMGA